MKSKSTNNLQNELMATSNLSRFLSENQESFDNEDLAAKLQSIFQSKDISKAALAKNSGMSEVYLYQIFSGGRNPSRNRIICLCFGLQTTLEEAQELLKCSGNAQLYVKDRRDAIIIYGLLHELTLAEVNDRLFAEKEKTLC